MSKAVQPKSHLSVTLRALLTKHNMTAADIHRSKPKLLNSFLSRILRGEQRSLNPRKLSMLAQCFHSPEEKAQLIAAHCLDECTGPGSELVVITTTKIAKKLA